MFEKRFWFHNLLIALLKLSPPGITTLSPTVRPETEINKDSSRYLLPVILMPAIVYSFGVFEIPRAIRSGSIDTGFVVSATWAFAAVNFNKQKAMEKAPINNRRCIQSVLKAAN